VNCYSEDIAGPPASWTLLEILLAAALRNLGMDDVDGMDDEDGMHDEVRMDDEVIGEVDIGWPVYTMSLFSLSRILLYRFNNSIYPLFCLARSPTPLLCSLWVVATDQSQAKNIPLHSPAHCSTIPLLAEP
jgi:hypothetical protein